MEGSWTHSGVQAMVVTYKKIGDLISRYFSSVFLTGTERLSVKLVEKIIQHNSGAE